MTPFTKKVTGGVMITLISAGLLWFAPYEYDHHVATNEAVIQVQQVQSDFFEYRIYQEYRDLKHEQRIRQLTQYEIDRLEYLQRELEEIRKRRYSK